MAALALLGAGVGVAALRQGPDLTGMFSAADAARRIGRAYLEASSPKATVDELLTDLFGTEARGRALISRGPEAVQDWLRAAQRKDFEAGRLVPVDGWMLARCEAAICAVVALS